MRKENENSARYVHDQFKKEIFKLSRKVNEEIVQMVDDYAGIVKSRYSKPPPLLEYLGFYDHLIISFIENLLNFRLGKRDKDIKKRMNNIKKREN